MPLDPEIAAEIAEARKIIREDKILAGQKALHDKLAKHFPDEPETPEVPEGSPPAPEPVDPSPEPGNSRKSRWWGNDLP